MSTKRIVLTVGLLLSVGATVASADVRRYGLVVGANDGGSGRPQLRYALSDAQSFARVMEILGGVAASDLLLLNQPRVVELEDALEDLRHRVDEAPPLDRTQVMVYFSGHANETGLLLGDEVFSYQSLRNAMDLIEADVRIGVLDACASGAITRLKGTRRRRAFLVDDSSEMRGHAFLTSSSADEVAQESDRIGASFFTHYLVSGLRGAADISGEGQVTLNEAYQFAFNETLGRTAETTAGAQHPSYDINLSGQGEMVMTDVRETSVTLVLGDDLSGRFFVRNSNQQLVVELFKLHGRSVKLGLEPGTYSIRCEHESGPSISTATLKDGEEFTLSLQHFTAMSPESVAIRGGESLQPRFGGLDGRWRLGLRYGLWGLGGLGAPQSSFVEHDDNRTIGLVFSYWPSEKWSVGFTTWTSVHLVNPKGATPEDAYLAAFLVGGRRYFPNLGGLRPSIKPFLSAAVGPYFRHAVASNGGVVRGIAAGGNIGGGFDIQVARWGTVGTAIEYNFTSDFSDDFTGTFGNKTSYQGAALSFDFSILLGQGAALDR